MKKYIGYGHKPNVSGPADVYVMELGTTRLLQHHVRHSVDGFSWGYAGSGPADLALSLLWDVLGEEPKPALYQRFKAEIVALWPMEEAACWAMTDTGIRKWIADTEAKVMEVLRK